MPDDNEKLSEREWKERLKLAHELFDMFKHDAYLRGEI